MGKYFGTDGFRGKANETLTALQAFRVGRFLGHYYSERREEGRARIVVGKDTRRSSYMLEYALAAGMTASGADAYLLHVTTTPSVSYVARTDGFDCGVMISASHNPYEDNGIKLLGSGGEKLDDKILAEIEEYLDGTYEPPYATGARIGRTVDYVFGRNRYIGYLISLSRVSFQGVRVGLDCANGSAWTIAKSVFDSLGASVTLIGAQPNGTNVNLGCGSTHIERLQQLVVEEGLDVGFAFDGDADRCIAVDEKGNVVDGDGIIFLMANYLKGRGELDGGVVATVVSNLALPDALKERGIECTLTQVGDKYVYDEMIRSGSFLGGEQSGHIIFRKHAATGDGILTAVKVMEAIVESECKLSKLTEGFKPYPQALKNVVVRQKEAILKSRTFLSALERTEGHLKGNGRVLVRPSGTESLVRILIECRDKALAEKAAEELAWAVLAADGEVQ
ncbi:MAG: phosphoglucosamine mutase [Clostridiales bacterium]|nr:phosphoglucosamine mutase [Clostridiales bacterium]